MKLKESGIRVESNAQQRAIFLKILAWEFMILLHIIIIDLNYYGNKFSIKLFTCCLLSWEIGTWRKRKALKSIKSQLSSLPLPSSWLLEEDDGALIFLVVDASNPMEFFSSFFYPSINPIQIQIQTQPQTQQTNKLVKSQKWEGSTQNGWTTINPNQTQPKPPKENQDERTKIKTWWITSLQMEAWDREEKRMWTTPLSEILSLLSPTFLLGTRILFEDDDFDDDDEVLLISRKWV